MSATKAKKNLILLLVVALLVPLLLAVPVSAATSGVAGTGVTWSLSGSILTISGNGAMSDFSAPYNVPWADYRSSITRIVIDPGITHIGNYSFYSFTALLSVSLPSSLVSIGTSSFSECTALEQIDFPSSLVSIGESAFNQTQMPVVIFPASLSSLGRASFWGSTITFYFLGSTPPSMNQAILKGVVQNIFVPEGSVSAYAAAFASDLTEYIAAGSPPSAVPDFTVIQSWDSSQVYAYQEETSADVFSVSASASGWNASYQWFYGSSQGGTFTAMPAETLATFTPKTTAEYLGTSVYYCAVTLSDGSTGESKTVNSGYLTVQVTEVEPPVTEPGGGGGGDDSGTSTPDYSEKLDNIENKLNDVQGAIEEVPEQITDGMQDIVDKEDQEAEQQGNEFVDQITGLVPNESQGFISALGSLVSALSYDGTDCVLPLPALVLPGISGLFGEARFMEAQQVDLEAMFNMMPSSVLLLVQSLCTIALIIFCFKELYATISYFFVLKGGET